MAEVRLCRANKVFSNGVHAVHDLDVTAADGNRIAILGPSGSGKSTTLRLIAGLESLTSGNVLFQGQSVKHISPVDRNVAMVFQRDALYPHMTVEQNIAFGLRMRNVEKRQVTQRVRGAADLLSIGSLLSRFPSELSGGQRQRVALGRAIVRQPQAFLLDEPLSGLDAPMRIQMRAEIVQLQASLRTTMIYVTHDQQEAMSIGEKLVVISDGVIQQQGTPSEIYRRPANRFVAGFVGNPAMNFVNGHIAGGQFKGENQRLALRAEFRDGPATLGIRPEHLMLSNRSDGSPISGRVTNIEDFGHERFIHVRVGEHQWTARTVTENPPIGETIALSFRDSDVHFFETRGSQNRLSESPS